MLSLRFDTWIINPWTRRKLLGNKELCTTYLFSFFQPFNWLLLKWIIVYIFLKQGFFFIELVQLTENWNWPRELKLYSISFLSLFDVHCCFKLVWCDSKKTSASLINLHGSFMIKCQIKHSLKLRSITENIGHYVPWTSILFIKDSCF